MALDPDENSSCSAKAEGGTYQFMSPERLMPRKYGMTNGLPTKEADVYSFGLVIFQVCDQVLGYRLLLYILSPGPYR